MIGAGARAKKAIAPTGASLEPGNSEHARNAGASMIDARVIRKNTSSVPSKGMYSEIYATRCQTGPMYFGNVETNGSPGNNEGSCNQKTNGICIAWLLE
ncbi:MAG: hypothetical protein ACK2TW_06655 [Anaerolineales bacterium]